MKEKSILSKKQDLAKLDCSIHHESLKGEKESEKEFDCFERIRQRFVEGTASWKRMNLDVR